LVSVALSTAVPSVPREAGGAVVIDRVIGSDAMVMIVLEETEGSLVEVAVSVTVVPTGT
jgi:hypothetical protein